MSSEQFLIYNYCILNVVFPSFVSYSFLIPFLMRLCPVTAKCSCHARLQTCFSLNCLLMPSFANFAVLMVLISVCTTKKYCPFHSHLLNYSLILCHLFQIFKFQCFLYSCLAHTFISNDFKSDYFLHLSFYSLHITNSIHSSCVFRPVFIAYLFRKLFLL